MSARTHQEGPAQPFWMLIDDVVSIAGRGTLVTGRIQQGVVRAGDSVEVVGAGAKPRSSVVLAVEILRKRVEQAQAGDAAGVLLRGIKREELARGQVLRAP